MRILPWEDASPPAGEGRAIAVGVFDGLHLGHRSLVERLKAEEGRGLSAGVLTFKSNPRRLFHAESWLGDIMSLDQKLEALEGLGIRETILVDFNAKFASLDAREFLEILRDRFGLRFLAMGENTHIGSGGRMKAQDAAFLAASLGLESEIVPALRLEGQTVSSSLIRRAIAMGDLSGAGRLLGRPWELDCRAWEASGDGACLQTDACRQVLPPLGRYRFLSGGGEEREADLSAAGKRLKLAAADGRGLPDRIRFV